MLKPPTCLKAEYNTANESLSRTAVGTRMIFGSLDRFQDASAFSTSVLAFCLPRKPRQSSLSLSLFESCGANPENRFTPAGLQAVNILYSV